MADERVFAHRQHQGARPYQEDSIGYQDGDGSAAPSLVVVADGMGGHAGGAEASDLAVKAFLKAYHDVDTGEAERFMAALNAANDAIAAATSAKPDLAGMGCTLLAASVDGGTVKWLSVGDSPMWRVSAAGVERLNDDHSMAPVLADLVAEGRMTADEAAADPRRNALRSAVMGEDIELIDLSVDGLSCAPGDCVILASDGLDTLSPDEIKTIAEKHEGDAGEIASDLVRTVLKKDKPGQDNVSVAVVAIPAAGAAVDLSEAETLQRRAGAPIEHPAAPPSKSRLWRPMALIALGGLLLAILLAILFSGGDDTATVPVPINTPPLRQGPRPVPPAPPPPSPEEPIEPEPPEAEEPGAPSTGEADDTEADQALESTETDGPTTPEPDQSDAGED